MLGLSDEDPRREELAARVRAALGGDRLAQAELFACFRMPLLRLCLSFPGIGQADAQDLVQETFIRALKGLGGLREPERFAGWIFAICRRRCLSWLAGQGRDRVRRQSFADYAQQVAQGQADEARQEVERRVVQEVIEAMEDGRLKDVGRLFYIEGLDSAQIAERLGSPQSSVTTWLARFRAKVRKRLLVAILELRQGGGEG